MDISKLPKLSDTKASEPPAASSAVPNALGAEHAAPQAREDFRPPPPNLGEVWISIGVGAFLLLMWPRFLQWLSSRLFHTQFDEFTLDNQVVPYQTLPVFWSDLGPTLIGVVLIVDGLLLFTRRPALIWAAFVLTISTVLFNLGWVVVSYGKYGFAPISFLAVVVGGFIASTQWRIIQMNRMGKVGRVNE